MTDKIRTLVLFKKSNSNENKCLEMSSNVLLSCGSQVQILATSPNSSVNSLSYKNRLVLINSGQFKSVRIESNKFNVCWTKSGHWLNSFFKSHFLEFKHRKILRFQILKFYQFSSLNTIALGLEGELIMKFFKHFTDAHRGRSMQSIFDNLGHEGISCWWILVEMCAQKLDKHVDEEFTEAHCVFVFNERLLRDSLRVSRTKLERMLNQYATLVLLSFHLTENEIQIQMPKLLECLDRDSKRARHVRGSGAPKNKKENKNKSGDVFLSSALIQELELQFRIHTLINKHTRLEGHAEARLIILQMLANEEPEKRKDLFERLDKSIVAYDKHCKEKEIDYKGRKGLPNFLETGEWEMWPRAELQNVGNWR